MDVGVKGVSGYREPLCSFIHGGPQEDWLDKKNCRKIQSPDHQFCRVSPVGAKAKHLCVCGFDTEDHEGRFGEIRQRPIGLGRFIYHGHIGEALSLTRRTTEGYMDCSKRSYFMDGEPRRPS